MISLYHYLLDGVHRKHQESSRNSLQVHRNDVADLLGRLGLVAGKLPLLNGRRRRGGVRNWWYEKVRRRFYPTAIAEC